MIEFTEREKGMIERIENRGTYTHGVSATMEKLFAVVLDQLHYEIPHWADRSLRETLLFDYETLLGMAKKLNEADVSPDDCAVHLDDNPFRFIWPIDRDCWTELVLHKHKITAEEWNELESENPNWDESADDAEYLLEQIKQKKGVSND